MNWRTILGLWKRRGSDAALIEELEFHRASIQADLESQGMSAGEARYASQRAMGNDTLAREDARDAWGWRWADQLLLDLRCSLRSLTHQRVVTVAALLATALGVATVTTVFSVADAELWKPLPFSQPHQLVSIYSRGPDARSRTDSISGADLIEWRRADRSFSAIALSGNPERQVLQLQTAESVVVTPVSANYFVLLGRPAISGRVFSDADGTADRQLVITDRAWRRFFSGDPAILGRSVRLDETPAVIIGVVASDDSLGPDPDLFAAIDERSPAFVDRGTVIGYSAIGRMRPGADVNRAKAELEAVVAAVPRPAGFEDHRIHVVDLSEYYVANNWRPLYFFLGASLVVLILSTINVATLLLSRAIRRAPEFALRRALGGGAAALARQLFVEGLLLAAVGGGLGILFASWAIKGLTPLVPPDILFRGENIPIDFRVAAFSLMATGLATIVFGLVPLPLARSAGDALRSGTRAGRPARESRSRSILLGVQIALTLVLLTGAGVFFKSFVALTRVPLGFDPANLASARMSLSGPRYANDESLRAFSHRLVETAMGVPGARVATVATSAPLGSGPLVYFARNGQPRPAPGDEGRAILRSVDAAYFRTLDIRILRGREFGTDDNSGSQRVAIINDVLARRLFGEDEDPIGQVIDLLANRAPWTNRPGPLLIVGLASNIKEIGINEVEFGDVYVPFEQMPSSRLELIVRTDLPPDLHSLRSAAANIDPLVPIASTVTFAERVKGAFAADVFNLTIVAGFAAVAILLSAIGIYGAAAYHVQARARDFGVRLALGGAPRRLVASAVWQTARPVVAGGAAGVLGVIAIARLIGNALYLVPGSHNGLLFGVTTTDPSILIAAFVGLLAVALIAAAIPARRLTRIHPMIALSVD